MWADFFLRFYVFDFSLDWRGRCIQGNQAIHLQRWCPVCLYGPGIVYIRSILFAVMSFYSCSGKVIPTTLSCIIVFGDLSYVY